MVTVTINNPNMVNIFFIDIYLPFIVIVCRFCSLKYLKNLITVH